jgi:hypothetical protein
MNKVLKTAAVACLAISAAQAADVVFWELGSTDIPTGSNATTGYWYDYNDENEGYTLQDGKPTGTLKPENDRKDGIGGCGGTNFPAGDDDKDLVGPAWEALNGAITYTYNNAKNQFNDVCTYKYAFAGVGTNWFDPKATIEAKGINPLDGMNSVKFYYSLTGDGNCMIELGADGATGYNNFTIPLPKENHLDVGKAFSFEDFKQDGTWGTVTTFTNAIQKSDALKFKCDFRALVGKNAGSNTLTFKKIVFSGDVVEPVLPGKLASSAKLNLSNNILSISGVNSDVKVDIVSLQGALVSSGTLGASKSISLSGLPSGVYMVRVNGLNLTQKIVVK